jgi:LmbE family N-acetylglucosaminyl deacetylase
MALVWPIAQRIYLSPHLDDVVLSCGGMIYQQTHQGETVAVVTVFAASPPNQSHLSAFARSLHMRWQHSAPSGLDFSDPPAVRREEDYRAFAILSPTIQVLHYSLPDCIYRCDPFTGEALYASEEALFGEVSPTDPALPELAGAPPLPAGATLYVPLGVGGHVDHQIIRRVAEKWGLEQERVRYYEDYPYATQAGQLEKALGRLEEWTACVIPLSEDALRAKIEAVAAYTSQISTFWQSLEAMAGALRSYCERTGGERLWLRCAQSARH